MVISHRQIIGAIEELTQVLNEDLNLPPALQQTIQDLLKIRSGLDSEKLNVCFFSPDLQLARSFYQVLSSYQSLEKFCQVEFQVPPTASSEVEAIPPSAYLLLQDFSEGKLREIRYPLPINQVVKVGRKTGCDVLIPDHYTRVSGHHLEIHCHSSESSSSVQQWQVQNCNTCRNGTYMNGSPLLETSLLKPGDRLTLGNELPTEKSPELVFECLSGSAEYRLENDKNSFYRAILDWDVLIYVTDSYHPCPEPVEELLRLASKVLGQNVFLAAPRQGDATGITMSQYPNSPVEIEAFCSQMASFSKREIAFLKTQRARAQTLTGVENISKFLLDKQATLAQEIKQGEKQSYQKNGAEDVHAVLKVIKEQKDSFSKSIEASLNQSKQDLLDDSLSDSMPQKIHDVIHRLKIHIFKQSGRKYLGLKPDGIETEVNEFIIRFCEQELLDWADEEWIKIGGCYGNGGLEGLMGSANAILVTVGEENSDDFLFQFRKEIEFDGVFRFSLRKVPCCTDYSEDPIFIYFINKIRSSVFQIMGVLFLLSFLGLSRGDVIRNINKQISSSPFLLILALGTIVWLLYKLYRAYQADKESEAQKVAEKIRKELQDYYQKITKNRFVEKVVQVLDANLKEEMTRFDREVKTFLEAIQARASEARINRESSQSYLRNCQDAFKKLDKQLREVQKVKDKLQKN